MTRRLLACLPACLPPFAAVHLTQHEEVARKGTPQRVSTQRAQYTRSIVCRTVGFILRSSFGSCLLSPTRGGLPIKI